MKAILIPAALAITVMSAAFTAPAQAGCLKGAAIGALAGHFVGGHSVLGAGAGCVVGRANSNRRYDERDRAYEPGDNYQPGISNYQRPQPYNGSDPRAYDRGYDQRAPGYDYRR